MGNTESHPCHISCASFINHFISHRFCLPFMKLYLKMGSNYSHYSISIILLKEHREEYEDVICRDTLQDHITSLQYGLHLLYKFSHTTDNKNFGMRIENVLYDVSLELLSLSGRPIDGSLVHDLDRAYTTLREKMKYVIVNPRTREYDVSSTFDVYTRDTFRFLLRDFDQLSEYRADAIDPLSKEIEDLKEKLMFLQPLVEYEFWGRYQAKYEKLVAFVAKAACLVYSYVLVKMDEETTLAMKRKLTDLLENLNVKEIYIEILTKPSRVTHGPLGEEFYLLNNLTELLDINSSIYLNESGEKLRDKLKFLQTFIANLPRELQIEKFHYFVKSVEKITCKAIPILYSCRDKDMKEDMAREVNDALLEVIDQIEDIQAEVQVIKLYDYPKTDGLGFLDLFLERLEELLKFQPELIEIMKSQIEILHVEFDFLRNFLGNIKEQHDENKEMIRDLRVRILGLAYQVEYIVDFYLVKAASDSRIMFSLTKIIEQTNLIKSEATKIYGDEKYYSQAQAHNVVKNSSCVASQANAKGTNEVVGFADEAEKMREFLFGNMKKRDVITIVGLPGLGKTTLARKIYEDPLLIEHFHVRAWCTVSQTYRTRDLLLTIIGDIIGGTEEINTMDDEDLAAKLYRSLKGRRYLIVIDDLWHVEAWNSLARSLPNDENHSRILVTSRLLNVAPQGSKVHFLRELSDDESWELFQKKIRQEQRLSQEIQNVGKRIVESCKRLPLAIVVIASLLEKMEKSVDKWKKVAENLNSHIFSDTESQCKAILQLSYDHLPDHLKSCFLYFGAFAEDEEIPLSKLKWLWIAEGFVRNTDTKSLEDVAEEYCLDLIGRSLVTSTKERSRGGVKACRVHDLLRDFCLNKAEEESFLKVIDIHRDSDFSRVYDQHRVIIIPKDFYHRINEIPISCSVRSLLQSASYETSHVPYLFENFKLLKVLDLGGTNIGNYFSKIELMIHLRYLALKASITSIPSSISNLSNLQFLLVKANNYGDMQYGDRKMVVVPDSIWDMMNLRRVHIDDFASFEVHANRLENSLLLNNLDTLSTPSFSCGADAENLLKRLPKLQKLKCIFLRCHNYHTHQCQYPELNVLDQLLSAKVIFRNWSHREGSVALKFPPNLQRLSLSFVPLKWDEISKIGRALPNLVVLKLDNGYSWDKTWFVDDGDFPKLKYLKLSGMDYIREWIASTDSFPILEQLVLDKCWSLNEIPPCFGEMPTLQKITVRKCKASVDDSARRIQMEQQDGWQNAELKVDIYPRETIKRV